MQQTEADDTDRQGVPGILHDGQAVITDAEPTKPFDPTDGSLHHPAYLSQTATVRRPPPGYVWLDAQPGQEPAGMVAVESPIRIQVVGELLGPTRFARHFR
jgi:hypothetical protein